jgi:UDP-N-acetylglucosamine--N-acetylmuramyl-(pentapeptide) pyrophosphoryl-undecaprenol N-acetylglucosamine transferase
MIFVSVGTHEAPFDRMLEAVHSLGLEEQLVVQYGPSGVRSDRAIETAYLSFDEMVDRIRAARAVVMHAGVGSVMVSLANGKRPIVMARQREHGEHVDDHQLELAHRLEAHGLVTLVQDREELARALGAASEARPQRMVGVPWLGEDLSLYVADQLG